MQARSLEDCLNADAALARLTEHATHLAQLQRIIETTIPTALQSACRVANYRQNILFIHADNGAVAAKLRQWAPSLGDQLRSNGVELTEIRVRVQPRTAELSQKREKAIAPLGERAKQGLTKLASDLPPDSPLRSALRRMLKEG